MDGRVIAEAHGVGDDGAVGAEVLLDGGVLDVGGKRDGLVVCSRGHASASSLRANIE